MMSLSTHQRGRCLITYCTCLSLKEEDEDLLHQQTVATYPLDDRLRRPLRIRISNDLERVVFSYRNNLMPLPDFIDHRLTALEYLRSNGYTPYRTWMGGAEGITHGDGGDVDDSDGNDDSDDDIPELE